MSGSSILRHVTFAWLFDSNTKKYIFHESGYTCVSESHHQIKIRELIRWNNSSHVDFTMYPKNQRDTVCFKLEKIHALLLWIPFLNKTWDHVPKMGQHESFYTLRIWISTRIIDSSVNACPFVCSFHSVKYNRSICFTLDLICSTTSFVAKKIRFVRMSLHLFEFFKKNSRCFEKKCTENWRIF